MFDSYGIVVILQYYSYYLSIWWVIISNPNSRGHITSLIHVSLTSWAINISAMVIVILSLFLIFILWTWVWVNSGSWSWTGRPAVLQCVGSQIVRHKQRLKWTELIRIPFPSWTSLHTTPIPLIQVLTEHRAQLRGLYRRFPLAI